MNLDHLPFLPVTTVGEVVIGRHKETLDLVIGMSTSVGPVTQQLSDELAVQLGLELIRESGRRAIRTQALLSGMQRALEATKEEPNEPRTQKVDDPDPGGDRDSHCDSRGPRDDYGNCKSKPVSADRSQFVALGSDNGAGR